MPETVNVHALAFRMRFCAACRPRGSRRRIKGFARREHLRRRKDHERSLSARLSQSEEQISELQATPSSDARYVPAEIDYWRHAGISVRTKCSLVLHQTVSGLLT